MQRLISKGWLNVYIFCTTCQISFSEFSVWWRIRRGESLWKTVWEDLFHDRLLAVWWVSSLQSQLVEATVGRTAVICWSCVSFMIERGLKMVVCVFPCLKNFKVFFKISIRGVTTPKHSSTKVIPSIISWFHLFVARLPVWSHLIKS